MAPSYVRRPELLPLILALLLAAAACRHRPAFDRERPELLAGAILADARDGTDARLWSACFPSSLHHAQQLCSLRRDTPAWAARRDQLAHAHIAGLRHLGDFGFGDSYRVLIAFPPDAAEAWEIVRRPDGFALYTISDASP